MRLIPGRWRPVDKTLNVAEFARAERTLGRVDRLARWSALWLGVGVALLTASLGLFPDLLQAGGGTIPEFVRGIKAQPLSAFDGRGPFLLGMLVASSGCFWAAWCCSRKRGRLLRERGTAFILDTRSEDWDVYDTRSFIGQVEKSFAEVLIIPNSTDLGYTWGWGRGREAAARWSEHVDTLISTFMAVRFNDDRATGDVLFIYADWAVATAFMRRLGSRSRGYSIEIRQRLSAGGTGGQTRGRSWEKPGSTFEVPASALEVANLKVDVTFNEDVPLSGDVDANAPETHVILLRATGPVPWLNAVGPTGWNGKNPIALENGSPARLAPQASLHQWVALPDLGGSHDGSIFEALATAAGGFVHSLVLRLAQEASDAKRPAPTFVIGALLPQEVSCGLGKRLGVLAGVDLYPIIPTQSLQAGVVVNLNLAPLDTIHPAAIPTPAPKEPGAGTSAPSATPDDTQLVNLTPHGIAVVRDDDDKIVGAWPVSGTVARLSEAVTDGPSLVTQQGLIPTDLVAYDETVTGLPAPSDGTVFIVSRVLAAQVQRSDLYFPSREVRDEDGQITGCRALGQFVAPAQEGGKHA